MYPKIFSCTVIFSLTLKENPSCDFPAIKHAKFTIIFYNMDILFRLSKIRKCTRDVFLNSEESRDRPNYQSNNVPNALAQFASFEELLSVKGIGLQGQVIFM